MVFISYLIQLYILALFAYAVFSWIRLSYDSPWLKVQRFLTTICDPVLRPVRKLIPPVQVGGVALDISFIIVVLVLGLFASILR